MSDIDSVFIVYVHHGQNKPNSKSYVDSVWFTGSKAQARVIELAKTDERLYLPPTATGKVLFFSIEELAIETGVSPVLNDWYINKDGENMRVYGG